MLSNRGRGEEGFTLVELMTVVLIIGILVAVAVASFTVSVARSRTVVCLSNQRLMDSGLMLFQVANGHWPTKLADVEPYVKWSGGDFATCASDPKLPFEYDKTTGEVSCPYPGHER